MNRESSSGWVFPVARHKPGRGSQVSRAERRKIQLAHLRDGLNQTELAAKFGRKRETVARCLRGPDFDALKQEVDGAIADEVRRLMRSGARKAGKAWLRAVEEAAKKGNHKPAKDLLLHTNIIEPLNAEPSGPQFQINIGMPGHPACPIPTQAEIEEASRRQAGPVIDMAPLPSAKPSTNEPA